MRRALTIEENSFGAEHPAVGSGLNNLALLLRATNRLTEAEPLMRRALAIDEKSYGPNHVVVATDLHNLALLLLDTNRLGEAEPLMSRDLGILFDFSRHTGHDHPELGACLDDYRVLLQAMGKSQAEIATTIEALISSAK